jgi:hypothetical protein
MLFGTEAHPTGNFMTKAKEGEVRRPWRPTDWASTDNPVTGVMFMTNFSLSSQRTGKRSTHGNYKRKLEV